MNNRMKTILVAGAFLAAASAVGSQAADQTDTPNTVNGSLASEDQRITDDVVARIAADPSMPANTYIQVETRDGVVTLNGRVDLPDQVDKAGRDAESVTGVMDVDNIVRPRIGQYF